MQKLQEELNEYFLENKTNLFTESWFDSDFIKNEVQEDYEKQIKDLDADFYYIFEDLAIYNLSRTVYEMSDKQFVNMDLIAQGSKYAYLCIVYGNKSCGCLEINPFLNMFRAGLLLSMQIMAKSWDDVEESAQALLDSVNGSSCIIRRGYKQATTAWFVMQLYYFSSDKEVNKKRASYPDDFYPYDKVLENWDTNNLGEVDKFTYLLCDMHLQNLSKSKEDRNIDNMELIFIFALPYEVISWINIRELKGLKNPKTFSHPLMNTPLAKMFLDIKEPLKKPKELPFSDELIAKLKEKCPDKEIEKQEPKATLKEKMRQHLQNP